MRFNQELCHKNFSLIPNLIKQLTLLLEVLLVSTKKMYRGKNEPHILSQSKIRIFNLPWHLFENNVLKYFLYSYLSFIQCIFCNNIRTHIQLTFACSNSAKETLKRGMKHVQS